MDEVKVLNVTYYRTQQAYEDRSPGLQYNCNGTRNLNLGDIEHFHGSTDDLLEVILTIFRREGVFNDYTIGGNLSLILGQCPDEYDYIEITND